MTDDNNVRRARQSAPCLAAPLRYQAGRAALGKP